MVKSYWWGGGPCEYCVSPSLMVISVFYPWSGRLGQNLGTVGDWDLDKDLTIINRIPFPKFIKIFTSSKSPGS